MNIELSGSIPDNPTSAPILFLHGMWHAAWCWEPHFMPYFSALGHPCYALSFRGHGKSGGNLAETGISDYVNDIAQAVANIGIPPIFAAHSMGGYALQIYKRDNAVRACVFMAAIPPRGIRAAAARVAGMFPDTNALSSRNMLDVIRTPERFKTLFLSKNVPDRIVSDYHSRMGDESQKAFSDMMRPIRAPAEADETPTLVLGAEHDTLISRAETNALARAYGTTPVIIPDIAHDMMLDTQWRKAAEAMHKWVVLKVK